MQAAAPETIAAPALLRELGVLGYDGQLRSLQALMKLHKPGPKPDPIVRFETEPGRQMQCDFVVFRRGAHPLYAFTATLGFSRWRWARFTTDEKAETLVACHHALFDALGGVPREILYDNAKTIVVQRDAYGPGQHRWHAGLLDVAKRYNFMPRLCQPYRPRTKGKVERFHRYLRGNFYVPLASQLKQSGLLLDVDTANAELGKWLRDVANQRVHSGTGFAPADLLEQRERMSLQDLPGFANTQRLVLPVARACVESPISIQHPLSIYQQLLTELRA